MINKNKFKEIFEKYFSENMMEKAIFEKTFKNPEILASEFSLFSGLTKITHTTLQSLDIKFGYFLEDLLNEIIYSKQGVKILDRVVVNENGKKLDYDSHFEKDGVEYIIEIKKRDNHDSTKWKGQLDNLWEKYNLSNSENKRAIIYFIDESYGRKNYKGYLDRWAKYSLNQSELEIYYSRELFGNELLTEDDWIHFVDLVGQASDKINQLIRDMLISIGTSEEGIEAFVEQSAQYLESKIKKVEKREEYKKILGQALFKALEAERKLKK